MATDPVDENAPSDPIVRSRREQPLWVRLILHYLPTRVYRQVLVEYDIAREAINKEAVRG